ncbi:MAG TPA: hypothetical protein VLO31_03405 [Cryobacterium sp.]|nr:hypothetical protein [Cryobacterium sp.]
MAIPSIVDDLAITSTQVQWVQESYTVGFAALLLVFGINVPLVILIVVGVLVFVLDSKDAGEQRRIDVVGGFGDPVARGAAPRAGGCRPRGVQRRHPVFGRRRSRVPRARLPGHVAPVRSRAARGTAPHAEPRPEDAAPGESIPAARTAGEPV